jgi:hypothetical protein
MASIKPEGEVGRIRVIRPGPTADDQSRIIEIPAARLFAGDMHYNVYIRPHDVIRIEASPPLIARLEVGADSLRYKGQITTWEQVSSLLEKMPGEDRGRMALLLVPATQDLTLRQFNEARQKARYLSRLWGLREVNVFDESAPDTKTQAATPPAARYYVSGEVARPGVYTLTASSITLRQALVAAGVKEADAAKLRIDVIRRRDKAETKPIANAGLSTVLNGELATFEIDADDVVRITTREELRVTTTTQPSNR